MAQNRDIEIGGVWANGAPDPPAEPIAENTYRNSTLTLQQVEKGWPFQKIVNSADFNEIMYRVTGLLRILEHWGMMPWSPLTTYAIGAHVLGSNNIIYKAIQATTGNDPISSPTQWENTGKGLSDHIAIQTNVHGSTNTPTANRLPQYDASGRLKSNAPSASNDVSRKSETDALQVSLDTHAGLTNPHSATATPTANRLAMWDANQRLSAGADANSAAHLVRFGQFSSQLAETGYQRLPSGLILQWGTVAGSEDVWGTRNFNIAFPNAALTIVASGSAGSFATDTDIQARVISATQFQVQNNAYGSGTINWIAIGH